MHILIGQKPHLLLHYRQNVGSIGSAVLTLIGNNETKLQGLFCPRKTSIFAFLKDIVDNIITLVHMHMHIVRITSPELQPMTVQYTGHMISICKT